ncbi:MAG: DUF1566 domain-containing protein [Methylococcales bacterium]|nr:DUF1566 domain-containing protein [Methylococcales bacterium]
MWLKDANCAHTIGHDPLGIGNGELGWVDALAFVAGINYGTYNISACASYTNHYSNWHLPNSNELASIINYSVPDNSPWLNSAGFTNVIPDYYLSSTTRMFEMTGAPLVGPILVGMRSGGNWGGGFVNYLEESPSNPWAGHYTWPVRVDELVAGTAPVWKTGQTTCYDGMISLGWKVVDCAGTGQDGDIRSGIESNGLHHVLRTMQTAQ